MAARRSRRNPGDSHDRPARPGARLLVLGGATLTVLGVVLFGGALVILGPLPDTLTGFLQRWAVRLLAAGMVSAGLWCAWTGWRRSRGE
jgi:protein-S-isoprenylcysteine O-methyltransferase Ste14